MPSKTRSPKPSTSRSPRVALTLSSESLRGSSGAVTNSGATSTDLESRLKAEGMPSELPLLRVRSARARAESPAYGPLPDELTEAIDRRRVNPGRAPGGDEGKEEAAVQRHWRASTPNERRASLLTRWRERFDVDWDDRLALYVNGKDLTGLTPERKTWLGNYACGDWTIGCAMTHLYGPPPWKTRRISPLTAFVVLTDLIHPVSTSRWPGGPRRPYTTLEKTFWRLLSGARDLADNSALPNELLAVKKASQLRISKRSGEKLPAASDRGRVWITLEHESEVRSGAIIRRIIDVRRRRMSEEEAAKAGYSQRDPSDPLHHSHFVWVTWTWGRPPGRPKKKSRK